MSLFKLKSLELLNFRSFDDLKVTDLHPHFNLLLGLNGSGKTNFLRGFRAAIGAWFADQKFVDKVSIDNDDRRIVGGVFVDKDVKFRAEGTVRDQETAWSRQRGGLKGSTTTVGLTSPETGFSSLGSHTEHLLKSIFTNQTDPLPVFAYLSTARLTQERSKKTFDPRLGRWNGYITCLSVASNKAYISDWLWRSTVDQNSRDRLDIAVQNSVLAAVNLALIQALIYLKVIKDIDQFELYYTLVFESIMIKVGDSSIIPEVPLDLLSDGTKNLIWMIIELAWRAGMLNPMYGPDAPAKSEGVVLIDEIDLHLHPKWQSKVIGMLSHVFPNIQFIATTHSPIIVSYFKEGTLYGMEGNQVELLGSFYGQDVNTVIEDAQRAASRPEEVKDDIDRFETLIGEREFKSEEYVRLKKKLVEILGELNPLFARAAVMEKLFNLNNEIHSKK